MKIVRSRYQQLTAADEQALAQKMHDLEAKVEAMIGGLDVAHPILGERNNGRERTRAARVDRLERAVDAVWTAGQRDRKYTRVGREARYLWTEVLNLRWQLAMSCYYIAVAEGRKIRHPNMDEEDLAQEGAYGLLRAAKRFEPSRGLRFKTYASWWVRAAISRAIDVGGRNIRLPGGVVEQIRNMGKAQAAMRDASTAELAELLDKSVEEVEWLQQIAGRTMASLEDQVDDRGTNRPRRLGDVLPDPEVDIEQETILDEHKAKLAMALACLPDRDRWLVGWRFGLFDGQPRTYADLGRALRLSRERVRQLEPVALLRLRRLIRELPPVCELEVSPLSELIPEDLPVPPISARGAPRRKRVINLAREKAALSEPVTADRIFDELLYTTSGIEVARRIYQTQEPPARVVQAIRRELQLLTRAGRVRREGSGRSTEWIRVDEEGA